MPNKYEVARDRENGSGIFYLYWRENGRQKRKSLRTNDEAEAQKQHGRFLLGQGAEVIKAAGITVTVADCWEVYCSKKLRKGRSEKGSEYKWNAMLKPHFSHLGVAEITDQVIEEYVEKRLSGRLGNRGKVTEPTVRSELIKLKSCLHFCSKPEYKQRLFDPALMPAIDLPDAGKPRERYLERDELDALFLAARRYSEREGKLSRIELFCLLAYATGGREQAILGLTFGRCSFETRAIELDDGERRKRDKKRATVYMNDMLHAVLKRALAESDQSVPLHRRLVLGHKGPVWATMQRLVHDAGLAPGGWLPPKRWEQPKATGISPHTLRHTAATHMAIAGIPLFKIAKFLGNTVEMVEKVYAKFQPKDLQDAAAVLDRGLRVVAGKQVA